MTQTAGAADAGGAITVPRFPPLVRTLRLTTGLILFTFATTHFLNHACGILRLPTMDAIRVVLLWPWRTLFGQTLLYGSFLTHGGLGLYALWRRRHLRIPPSELAQLLLGLSIPPLVIIHAVNVRLGYLLFDLPLTYPWLIYRYWELSPLWGLPRQFLLLCVVWTHGCIGLRSVMRHKPWYPAWTPALFALAVLIPALAMSGIIDAGRDFDARAAQDSGYLAGFNLQSPKQAAALGLIASDLILIYLGLVGGVFALHAAREWHARRHSAITIAYPGRQVVTPRGFSILEASRFAGVPHHSVCGGRGRCSTCRVRIESGLSALPAPNAAEARTLAAIGAGPSIRLACQLRPTADVSVTPLLSFERTAPARRIGAQSATREHEIAALFVDLRNSTVLADSRLPYDAFYVIDRYVGAVCEAVEAHAGQVTSVAGDGVMCFFDCKDAETSARQSLLALRELWRRLLTLSAEFESAFDFPLRFGAGCHIGVAVVGALESRRTAQFLGEVGNIAARLENLTKDPPCTAILSREVVVRAGFALPAAETRRVRVRNVSREIETVAFHTKEEFDKIFRVGDRLI